MSEMPINCVMCSTNKYPSLELDRGDIN